MQKAVFDVLYKIADLPFLGDHKDKITEVIEKAKTQPNLTIGVIVSIVVVIFSILLKLLFGGKKATRKVNVAPKKKGRRRVKMISQKDVISLEIGFRRNF